MKSALLRKRAFTGYPGEIELLESGGDRLFEVDSLRVPDSRMLVALAEDGSTDYPVYDPDTEKVKWKFDDRFGKGFKSKVKKHMQGEVEKAETPKETEEAVNDPALRKAASTGLECQFIEYKPGQWYYLLENWNSPKGAWDWREFAFAYGPFSSYKAAREHLADYHANPGGSSTLEYAPEHAEDDVLKKLIADAPRHTKTARLEFQCPFCKEPNPNFAGRREGQSIYHCTVCDRRFPLTEKSDVPEPVFAAKDVEAGSREDLVNEALRPRSPQQKAVPSTAHDLRLLHQSLLHSSTMEKEQEIVEAIEAAAKRLGSREVRIAAAHYLAILDREWKQVGGLGTINSRTLRARDRAFKRLSSAITQFVR